MRIPRAMASLWLAIAGLALLQPALASATLEKQPVQRPVVSERIARDIAWSFGIVRIDEIALAGARWEIAGRGSGRQ